MSKNDIKKIKDLTKEEFQSICNKHNYCQECPLMVCNYCASLYITHKKKFEEKIEEKIEVEN